MFGDLESSLLRVHGGLTCRRGGDLSRWVTCHRGVTRPAQDGAGALASGCVTQQEKSRAEEGSRGTRSAEAAAAPAQQHRGPAEEPASLAEVMGDITGLLARCH